jgi:hypothetical protein
MNILKKLAALFSKKETESVPLLIIMKGADEDEIKEFKSIEEVIAELENNPNIPADKMEKLKSLVKKLKKHTIKIKDGEIID